MQLRVCDMATALQSSLSEAVDSTSRCQRSDFADSEKEILTPPKIPPSTLDQATKWLEEMQHRLNLCIKTKQTAHP